MPGCRLPALAGCLCATLSLLHPAVYCARSPFSTFPSPWYQASNSWGGGGRGWAIPTQCWAHSVPFTTAPLLRAGGRIAVLDVRIPPCPVQLLLTLLQPLECHARILLATCVTFICHLASGPYASRSTLKLRPVYLHLMWCPSTSIQHCAPYTPGRLIAVLDIQASPSQLTHRSLLHTLYGAPAIPVPRLHLAKAPLPLGSPSLLRSYGSLHTYSAVGSSILTAVAAHSTPLRLDVYYISLQLQQASVQYIPTLTLGTFRHRTAVTFPVPSFGHHSIGPQRGTGRGVFIGVDLGPAIRLRTVGPEAPRHKVPRRLAGLGSLPRFPGVLLPFLCQANKRL